MKVLIYEIWQKKRIVISYPLEKQISMVVQIILFLGVQASPSVLTWRTVVNVVTNLVHTLTDLNVSFNTGVDLQILAAGTQSVRF